MFAVGIDVSNGRSTVAVLQSKTKVILKPFEVAHTAESLNRLAGTLNDLGDGVRIVMEHTGRYYESVAQFLHGAGFFVSALNPLLIKEYGDGRLRGVKTDKTDAVKIARFCRRIKHRLQKEAKGSVKGRVEICEANTTRP